MANKQITDLPVATALNGSEAVHLVQSGSSKQANITNIATYIEELNPYAQKVFASADLLKQFMLANPSKLVNGTVVYGGSEAWQVLLGSTAITSAPNLTPINGAKIAHFGDNAVPGSTDMTTIIEAAGAWSAATGRGVIFPKGDYKISRRCIVPGARFFGEFGARIVANASDFTNANAAVQYTNTSALFDFSGQLVSPYTQAPFGELVGFDFIFSGTQERRIDVILARNVAGVNFQNLRFYNFAAGIHIRLDSVTQPWQADNCRSYDCTTSFNLVNSTKSNIQISVVSLDADRVNGVTSVPGRTTRIEGVRLLQTGAALATHAEQSDVVSIGAGEGHFIFDIRGTDVGEVVDNFADYCTGGNFFGLRAVGAVLKLIHGASGNSFSVVVGQDCGRQTVVIASSANRGNVENNVVYGVVSHNLDPVLAYFANYGTNDVRFESSVGVGSYQCRNNMIIGLTTNSPNAKSAITNSGAGATNNAVIGFNYSVLSSSTLINDSSADKSLMIISPQLGQTSPSFTTTGQFAASQNNSGAVYSALVLANPVESVAGTAVQIEMRPNSTAVRRAFIRSTQGANNSTADLSLWTSNGDVEIKRLEVTPTGAVNVLTGPFSVVGNSSFVGGASFTGAVTLPTGSLTLSDGPLTVTKTIAGTIYSAIALSNPATSVPGTAVQIELSPNSAGARKAFIRSTQGANNSTADISLWTANGGAEAKRLDVTPAGAVEIVTGPFTVSAGGATITGGVTLPTGSLAVSTGQISAAVGNIFAGKTTNNLATVGVELLASGRVRATATNDISLQMNRLGTDGPTASFNKDGAQVGSISLTAAGTTYGTTSHRPWKENIELAANSGEAIDAIEIVSYDWKNGAGHVEFGVIAQDLFEVFPSAVTRGKEDNDQDPWLVDMSKTVPLLILELQSLRARVMELESTQIQYRY